MRIVFCESMTVRRFDSAGLCCTMRADSPWTMVACNALIPQLFWFKRLRRSIPVMFVIALLVNVGMWFERFVIVVTSLSRDFLPSSWGHYTPSFIDIGILIGSFGLFFTLILIFVRVLPVVSMAEVKGSLEGAQPHHGSSKAAAPATH